MLVPSRADLLKFHTKIIVKLHQLYLLNLVYEVVAAVSDGSGPRPGPSPTRARPFLEGPSPVLTEGPKPGPARARRQKPGGLEGLVIFNQSKKTEKLDIFFTNKILRHLKNTS